MKVKRLLSLLVLLGGALAVGAAEPDRPGSRDPHGIERFPRSWIVDYQRDDAVVPRELMTSRVDRIRRELRVEDVVRVQGTLEAATYQLPDDASVAAVFAHYREVLGDEVLFRCEGRGCGRSADWAHQVFGQTLVYGPDANQRYAAFEWRDRLVSVYVNERGNKRVYAHVQVLDPEGAHAIAPNAMLVQRLLERGWTVIDAVTPQGDGGFAAEDRRTLGEIGGRLDLEVADRLYLVCHLAGGEPVEALLTASQRCAEQAVRQLTERRGGGEAAGGPRPQLVPFGAGPLLPRLGLPASRLELVLPEGSGGTGPPP